MWYSRAQECICQSIYVLIKILCARAVTEKKCNSTAVSLCLLPPRSPFLLGNMSGVKTLKPPSRNRKIEWEGSDKVGTAICGPTGCKRARSALLDKYHVVNMYRYDVGFKTFSAARASPANEKSRDNET